MNKHQSTVECKQTPEGAIVPAVLLDSDNQPLSTGEALIYTAQSRGVFWPQEPANRDTILKSATSVQMSDGQKLAIHNLFQCPAQFPPEMHFHFELLR